LVNTGGLRDELSRPFAKISDAAGSGGGGTPMRGPIEVDETYIGGKRQNMSNSKRKSLADSGRGVVGKTAIVGAKG